jgi:hypothetical protein
VHTRGSRVVTTIQDKGVAAVSGRLGFWRHGANRAGDGHLGSEAEWANLNGDGVITASVTRDDQQKEIVKTLNA